MEKEPMTVIPRNSVIMDLNKYKELVDERDSLIEFKNMIRECKTERDKNGNEILGWCWGEAASVELDLFKLCDVLGIDIKKVKFIFTEEEGTDD